MWIFKYNINNELKSSVNLNKNKKIQHLYLLKDKEFIKYNDWGKNNKTIKYEKYNSEVSLIAQTADKPFFRTIKKGSKIPYLKFPKKVKELEINNNQINIASLNLNKL